MCATSLVPRDTIYVCTAYDTRVVKNIDDQTSSGPGYIVTCLGEIHKKHDRVEQFDTISFFLDPYEVRAQRNLRR